MTICNRPCVIKKDITTSCNLIKSYITCCSYIICNTITTAANATIGGVLIIPIGSSSAPSLHFAGDSTTGIYRNVAVTLSITSNSIETARFNHSQIQFFAALAMGSNTINGAITLSGANTNSMPYFDSSKELNLAVSVAFDVIDRVTAAFL